MEDESTRQDEDNEIFEITDFTNASPWETFISEIENILVQWDLTSSTLSDEVDGNQSFYEQHRKSEKLSYAKHAFIISLHVSGVKKRPLPKQPDQNWPDPLLRMMDSINDFPPVAHHITRWYGIEQFVLIAPDDNSEALTSEAQTKLMLSSVSLAVYNVGCTTPVFIQIQKHWRHIYTGVCEGNGLRTNFDMVHLKKTPPQFDHLSGMISLFRSKLGKPPSIKRSPVTIAARITYYLRHWRVEDWPIEPLGEFKGVLTEKEFTCLPLGATIDPVRELHLSALWSGLTETTIVDNNITSGFNPLYAPLWTVKTNLVDNPGLILNEQINEFIKICYRQDSIENLLANKLIREDMRSPGVGSSDFSHALTRLTGPPSSLPSFSSVMYSSSSRLEFGTEMEPISDEQLDTVLQYLFPDSVPDSSIELSPLPEDKIARLIKSAHPDSFTARLARVLCIVNREYGLKAFAHVWYEVVLELRYRWEKGINLMKVGTDVPDMMSCLLHQKLQMLNCCIGHKISHAQKRRTPSSSSTRTSRSSVEPEYHSPSSSLSYSQRIAGQEETVTINRTRDEVDSKNDFHSCSSSDDEFFEAFETPSGEPSSLEKSIKELSMDSIRIGSPSIKPKTVDMRPVEIDPLSLLPDDYSGPTTIDTSDVITSSEVIEASNNNTIRAGAVEQCKDLVLLRTGEPLCIPETQDQAPLTEDMLWEQQHVLSKLGTTEEATQVRAKMQSLSLISDMQSFKAANPGCVLEDFVRWYSPRDWIEGKEEINEEEETVIVRADSHPTDGWDNDNWEEEGLSNEEIKTYVDGHLSVRMRQPGNMWVESWENATPIPVYRQKKLFDDTKEAEKVLHYLSGLKLSELSLMLLPLVLHSAVIAVENKLKTMPLGDSDSLIQDSINILSTIQKPTVESLPIYQECLSLLRQAEHQFAIANSLLLKFHQGLEIKDRETDSKTTAGNKELRTSIRILVQENEELVLRDPTTSLTGIALQGLLLAQEVAAQNRDVGKQKLSKPAAREFILRTVCPHPSPYSSSCPQRMFCLLSKDEMRLAACYSEDIVLT